jgi:hypothetical protein
MGPLHEWRLQPDRLIRIMHGSEKLQNFLDRRLDKTKKKVMNMVSETTSQKDVAEPDQVASGMAGTGHENTKNAGLLSPEGGPGRKSSVPDKNKRNRETIGLGVLYNGPVNAGKIPDTAGYTGIEPDQDTESPADLIFYLYDRQDRIAERINKKIDRLDYRLRKMEARRRAE